MSVLKKTQLLPLAVVISTIIAGCGGSDNKNKIVPKDHVNQLPTVSVENATANENTQVILTATASDPDGEISLYRWRQVSGIDVTLSDVDAATLTFTAPAVDADTTLTFEITVTDDDGGEKTATATVSVVDVPQEQPRTLTLRGKAAAANPLEAAQISLALGSNNSAASATTDESGLFNTELSYVSSQLDQMVTITATGQGDDDGIRLMSLVPLRNLVDSAGSSGEISYTENNALYTNALSTSINGLMYAQNNNQTIRTVEEYRAAKLLIAPEMPLPMATAINVMSQAAPQQVQGAPSLLTAELPPVCNDTAHCAEMPSVMSETILEQMTSSADDFTAEQTAILDDSDAVSSNMEAPQATTTLYAKSKDEKFDGDRYIMNPDGTGQVKSRKLEPSSPNMTWEIGDDGLKITYGETGVLSHDNTVEFPESETAYKAMLMETKIKFISSGETNNVMVEHVHKLRPEGVDDTSSDIDTTTPKFGAQLIAESGVKDAESFVESNNAVYYIPTPTGQNEDDLERNNVASYVDDPFKGTERGTMKVSFDTDGNASMTQYRFQGDNMQELSAEPEVSYENGHMILDVDQSGFTAQFDLAFFCEDFPCAINGMLTSEFEGQQVETPITSMVLKKDSNANWTSSNIPGIYTYKWNMDSPNEHQWVELRSDNVAIAVKTVDDNENGQLEDSEFSIDIGKWALLEDGKVEIRRYSQTVTAEAPNKPRSCDSEFEVDESGDCKIWNIKTWDLQNASDSEMYIVAINKFYQISQSMPSTGDKTGSSMFSSIDLRRLIRNESRPVELPEGSVPAPE